MIAGIAYGALLAFGLGVGKLLGTFAARRVGPRLAAAATLVIAFVLLIGYAYVTDANVALDSTWVPRLVWLGCAVGASYLLLLRALELGPASVVSPITAGSGAATVLFAFLVFGERSTLVQWPAVPVTTRGAVLASASFERGLAHPRLVEPGAAFAALAVVAGAVSNAGLRQPIRDVGPLPVILGQRAVTVVVVWLIVVAVWRKGQGPGERTTARGLRPGAAALLLLLGAVDALSCAAFAEGLLRAPAWLVGLVSQSGRVVAVLGGLVVFHERLRPSQWAGIALAVVGLTTTALG